MNKKNMAKMINAKFQKWVRTIEDEKVRDLVRNGTILSGGAIASMVQGEDINDYDFYFKDYETCLAVAEYYVKQANRINNTFHFDSDYNYNDNLNKIVLLTTEKEVNILMDYKKTEDGEDNSNDEDMRKMLISRVKEGAIIPYINGSGVWKDTTTIYNERIAKNEDKSLKIYAPIVITSNAISLTDDVQLILRFYGNVEELHKNYDFQHAFGYWESGNNKVVIDVDTYDCITSKTLIYKGSRYPLCSLARIRKFIARGYTISAGELLKITYNLAMYDYTDVDVLEDQLMGLDSTYFVMLIEALRKWKINKTEEERSMSIIDFISDKIDEIF